MSTATIERPIERASEALSEQTQRAAIASPRPYWPLPGTRLPNAHFTWPEWVARLTERLANERHDAQSASTVNKELSLAVV